MALKLTVDTAWGLVAQDAYHRVESLSIEDKNCLVFSLRSYMRADGLPFFTEKYFRCAYDIDGANPYRQAYEYVKTLPEFAGAVDC